MKILIVKLSSLGDVLHNLPIVWDIRQQYPNAQIDWIIDELYVELIKPLESTATFKGIDHIIPIALRRWHKELKNWQYQHFLKEFNEMREHLNQHSYDLVIETQGLVKSAIVCRLAKLNPGAKIVGLGNKLEHSSYEPISKWFYTHLITVNAKSHAVDFCRAIAAGAINKQEPPNRKNHPPKFYPPHYLQKLQMHTNPINLEKNKYIMCFHATSRISKCWDLESWIVICRLLSKKGFKIVLPWGSSHEKKISEILASNLTNALVPRSFSLNEAFILISQAKFSIGVDTGLTHLSSVLLKPTIELYVDTHKCKYESYWESNIYNLGDKKTPPDLKQVKNIVEDLLAHSN